VPILLQERQQRKNRHEQDGFHGDAFGISLNSTNRIILARFHRRDEIGISQGDF
jgi:hypothetical protein